MSYATTFRHMRQLAGYPVAVCTKPRTSWTAPSGYAYDADYDAFVDSSGNVWKPDQGDTGGTVPTDTVNILPVQNSRRDMLVASGVMAEGDILAHILPADYATVRNAQYISVDSVLYDEAGMTPKPGGGSVMWYEVILRKR